MLFSQSTASFYIPLAISHVKFDIIFTSNNVEAVVEERLTENYGDVTQLLLPS